MAVQLATVPWRSECASVVMRMMCVLDNDLIRRQPQQNSSSPRRRREWNSPNKRHVCRNEDEQTARDVTTGDLAAVGLRNIEAGEAGCQPPERHDFPGGWFGARSWVFEQAPIQPNHVHKSAAMRSVTHGSGCQLKRRSQRNQRTP